MKRETAEKIAKDFLNQMNPEMWDGNGEKPESVNTKIWEYDLCEHDFLDVGIEYNNEEKTWEHCCEIVDKKSGLMTEILHGYGIDSYFNLADTIEDICQGY